LFDRVRVTSDRFEGVAVGTAGYIIGAHGADEFEVEISVAGGDVSHIVVRPEDVQRAEPAA
jgi:hypothetical protein